MIHILFVVTCLSKKAIVDGHVINEGRKIYNGRHACLTNENKLSL